MASHSRIRNHKLSLTDGREAAFLAEHGYTRAPTLVQWMATLRCPLKCEHCLAASSETGFDDMPLSTALELIDEVAEMGVDEFLLTGGEPLARDDLPAVVDRLGGRGVPWSLNTSALPSVPMRAALERGPPQFVAVSLDGPKDIHDGVRGRKDAFEESLEAIRFFGGLPGCEVAAGTTVTTRNFGSLNETFHIAAHSGADQWGIHLLVPEGRAEQNRDLFLSKGQLRRLLRFVARKRRYFPVTMADEFGYCGDWEPMVRDLPFRCGAGRAQCVVLPDGSVVPCTTLDRSAAAGNIHDRPLSAIWADGFAELRAWQAEGKCQHCEYAPACSGGCWLLRRKGKQCFRTVWHVPEAVKTAAGVAVCLGALSAGADLSAEPKSPTAKKSPVVRKHSCHPDLNAETSNAIERSIIEWYCRGLTPLIGYREMERPAGPSRIDEALATDPAGSFLLLYMSGPLPNDIKKLSGPIQNALKTKHRSLALSALLWRIAMEWCLDVKEYSARSPEERQALREVLSAMETTTMQWRKEIFDRKLDPYLARGRVRIRYPFMVNKAGRPMRPFPQWIDLVSDTSVERWGHGYRHRKKQEALEGFLDRHPFAEQMKLSLKAPPGSGLLRRSASGEERLKEEDFLGVYDILCTPGGDAGPTVKLDTSIRRRTYEVSLPPNAELTYADALQLAYAQNREAMDAEAKSTFKRVRTSVLCADPMLLPAMRAAQKAAAAGIGKLDEDSNRRRFRFRRSEADRSSRDRSVFAWWLADFWMF